MKQVLRHCTKLLLGLVLAMCLPTLVFGEDRLYHLEIGLQGGGAYYVGELSPYAFMSMGEAYGLQARCKIDRRWALQLKGQRQRVINTIEKGNDWGIRAGVYQVPMWHFDVTGEYNFFRLGLDEYDMRMKPFTPFIFVGIGMTVHNVVLMGDDVKYPKMWVDHGNRLDYALYVPVGVGLKWKFADRWQLQFAWQHNLYMLNGDGLEGAVDRHNPSKFNDSYGMNGNNVMNNDVTSTLTVGVVFEFASKKDVCVHCYE